MLARAAQAQPNLPPESSFMPSPRQTLTFLMKRFEEAGIHPTTRHGQNFLIDLNLLDILLDAAAIGPDDVVLEIGTGMGSLTTRMAESAGAVITVEIDPRLHQMAYEELIDYDNVTMLLQDALHNKNNFAPEVIAAVRAEMAKGPRRQFKLVANLPYNVATPILSNLLTFDPPPVAMVATIQKELAERMVAAPGTKDYSALSIWMQALAEIEIVRLMPPQVFWPKPKVHSAIVKIVPNADKRGRIVDLPFFHEFVRNLFLYRRKFLRSVLIHTVQDYLDKAAVDEILGEFQFGPDVRAEQLDVETFIALADAVRVRAGR